MCDLQKALGRGNGFSAVLFYPRGCELRQCKAALPVHHHCESLVPRTTDTIFPNALPPKGTSETNALLVAVGTTPSWL